MTKFDMSAAWSHAVAMFKARPFALLGMAFLAIIVPFIIMSLIFAGSLGALITAGTLQSADPFSGMGAGAIGGLVIGYFVFIILMMVGQAALMALAGDGERLGFGGALGAGFKSLPSLLGVMVIGLIAYMVILVPLAFVGAALGDIGAILPFLLLLFLLWVLTRFSLTMALIVLGQQRNPLKALGGSWSLTGQSQWRLLLFYVLLAIVSFVLLMVFVLLFGGLGALAFATGDGGAMGIGMIIGVILYIAAYLLYMILFVAVVAAAYYQFAGTSAGDVSETFA